MQLYVVRHGQTLANVQHRYLGALNPELTNTGREQAVALRMKLPDAIDSIVVSPLLRARQTADIIRYRNDLPLLVVDAFRERNVGVFEGLTRLEAQAQHPELWQQNINRRWDAAPPQGESIQQRVREAADRVALKAPLAGRSRLRRQDRSGIGATGFLGLL